MIIICNATCSCMQFKNTTTSCNLLYNYKQKKNVSRETFYLTKYLLQDNVGYMLIKLNNKNKQKGNNMTYEQKKFEGYTEGQMAREILMNAIAEALDTENKHVRTELEQIGDDIQVTLIDDVIKKEKKHDENSK